MNANLKYFVVSTHAGDFHTAAPSPAKAINNVRFRVFGRRFVPTKYWTVAEERRVA